MSAALADQFPVHVLREYALVADGERGALHGPHGDLVWLCAPRWHDDAVFSRLVGGGGTYAVTPAQPFVWGGSYEPGSLIWGNRWVTGDNVVSCREALAMPADPHRAVVLRQVVADQHDVRVQVLLDVRAGFGHHRMRQVRRHEDGTWTARTGDLQVRWSGARDAVLDDHGVLRLDLHVTAGQRHDLVLEISDRPLPEVPDARAAWAATEDAWRAAPDTGRTAAPRDAAQAIAVLRGLTSTTGGMVAAATMSLPERADQHRNYDYRYVWVRDQCYAGLAAAAVGADDLLDAAVRFVTARLLTDGDQLKPAYLPDGGPVPDERTLRLPGYPGGRDVVGNWVNQQFQLDALGEVLQVLSAAAAADRLDNDGHRAMQLAADVIERRWQQPDAGIWELDDDWWTHSRLACVAGLRAFSHTGHGRRGGSPDCAGRRDLDRDHPHLPAPGRLLATKPHPGRRRRSPAPARGARGAAR